MRELAVMFKEYKEISKEIVRHRGELKGVIKEIKEGERNGKEEVVKGKRFLLF